MDESELEKLRELIVENGIGYYLVLTQDAHCSEYVSPCDKRRECVSGFTGSAGTAIIGADGYLELATDGRYWQQADSQLGSHWVLRKEGSQGVATWSKAISERAKAEQVAIGVDPRLITYELAGSIRSAGVKLKAVPGLVDKLWNARKCMDSPSDNLMFVKPIEPAEPVFTVPDTVTGQSRGSKLADLRQALRTAGADVIVLSALDEIAWVLNMRGADIEYNPVFKAYLTVSQQDTILYISPEHELPSEASELTIKNYDTIFEDIRVLGCNSIVWVPPHSSWAMADAAGPKAMLDRTSPIELSKAVKNTLEIDGARKAQKLCGTSVVRLLSWLQQEVKSGKQVSEYDASLKLLEFRSEIPEFRGLSFSTISSSGPNASVIHYSPPKIGSRCISNDEVFLLDSGCQFLFGTTDTTRTAWFGDKTTVPDDVREAYTLVLKGHVALATSLFPQGTHGYKLDALARQYLWKYGLDYAHGTGHGVGSYLNVHEGPIGISTAYSPTSVALQPGNIVSNEPGYYKPDGFGIRIESLIVVKAAEPRRSSTSFLRFETITLAPFDRNLIDASLLTKDEITWINSYHADVCSALESELCGDALEYLLYHTAPIK